MIYDIRPRGAGIVKTTDTLKSGANGVLSSHMSPVENYIEVFFS